MRILFITQSFPFPLLAGDTILAWNTLQHLTRRHDVDLVSLAPASGEDGGLTEKLRRFFPVPARASTGKRLRQLASLFSARGAIEAVNRDPELERAVARALGESAYDVVIIDHLRIGWVLETVRAARTSALVVLRSHNCESDVRRLYAESAPGLLALPLRVEHRKTLRYEQRVVRGVDAVIAISREDAEAHAQQGARRTFVVPPGLDFGGSGPRSSESKWPGSLVLVGSFGYFAKELNALFLLQDVFPRVRARIPHAHLFLVGSGPSRRLSRAAASTPGVTLTGRVPDVRAIAQLCQVFVMPTVIGGGFELKSLEAISMGLPIVGTRRAVRGLELSPQSVRVEDGAADLASAIVALLADEPARDRQAAAAYREASQLYAPARVNEALDHALLELMKESRALRVAG